MHSRGIAHLHCEVLEPHETRNFGEEKLDPSTVFHFATKKKQKEPDKEDEDKVKTKSRRLVTAKKKKSPLKKMTWEESSDEDSDQEEEEKVKTKSSHWVTVKKKKSPLKKTALEDSSDEELKFTDTDENEEILDWASDEETQLKKTMKLKKTKARIPPGWSVRPERSGTRGPLPRCKGCKGKINCDSKCIRLKKCKSSFSHVHQDACQCHCRVDCLARADRSELKKQ